MSDCRATLVRTRSTAAPCSKQNSRPSPTIACIGDSAARLAALRAELARARLDGFLVPRADAHQNEYVAKCAERLAWLTGFSGSAGFAVVLEKRGGDLRRWPLCHSGARRDRRQLFAPLDIADETPARWLADHAREGARIGYDPWVHTPRADRAFRQGARAQEDHARRARANPHRRAVGASVPRRADGRGLALSAALRRRERSAKSTSSPASARR